MYPFDESTLDKVTKRINIYNPEFRILLVNTDVYICQIHFTQSICTENHTLSAIESVQNTISVIMRSAR